MIEGDGYALLQGNCLEALRDYEDCTFASVVCDPPCDLDSIPTTAVWAEISRVAAPGAFLLAFSHPRTWHRLACAIEDAGWVCFDAMGQLITAQEQSRRRLKQAWRPIVVMCKGLNVLERNGVSLVENVDTFTLADLVRLVTPVGGCILDPFMGSGSIGLAALEQGFTFVGIESDPSAFEVAKARLSER